jgi:hypothetical protein
MRSCDRRFDGRSVSSQNGFVHRLIFALGLSALLWTAARTTPAPQDIVSMSGVVSCAVAGDSHSPSDSDQQWQAAHHAIGVVTESLWKSAPVHAGLCTARVALTFETSRTFSAADPPAASAPPYLRHTPLLI